MPENGVFSCVPFCLRSLRRFERCGVTCAFGKNLMWRFLTRVFRVKREHFSYLLRSCRYSGKILVLKNPTKMLIYSTKSIQCPLDIATLDIAAALPIATSNPVTNLHQSIKSDLGCKDLKYQLPAACGIVMKRVKFLLLFLLFSTSTTLTTLTTLTNSTTQSLQPP